MQEEQTAHGLLFWSFIDSFWKESSDESRKRRLICNYFYTVFILKCAVLSSSIPAQ